MGTVLFQPSYGKENKLLCCLGNDASEPAGSSFTGRMLREVAVCPPVPVLPCWLRLGCGTSQLFVLCGSRTQIACFYLGLSKCSVCTSVSASGTQTVSAPDGFCY